jgi:hypothetical protein
MTSKHCPICFASFALVGKVHNCSPRSRPSWLPPEKAEQPAPEPKSRPATQAETIDDLRKLCKQPPSGRAAAPEDEHTPQPAKRTKAPMANGVANVDDVANRSPTTYRYRNAEARRAYMRNLMKRRRTTAASS